VRSLPTGVVTFLLTDIEASTRRWEQEPDAMREAMFEHDLLFQRAVEMHGGVVVKPRGEGDSGFSVFPRATEAVAAAVEFQRGVFTTNWPTDTPLRVRMALHTGEADLRSGDYYGSTVNRCARLRALAWGGQALMSLAAAQLVRENLPSGVSLRDLGQHRLKDLSWPEHVYQLVIPDIPNEFPSLRSLDRHATNLPVQATPFIGREGELRRIREWLLEPSIRLITLTGPGGSGKTRLGLQVAASVVESFEDGVFLISFESIPDPSLVLQTVAETVGARESGGMALLDSLNEHLRDKSILLVIDNFERLVSAGPQLSSLLAVNPGLKLLFTSREALRVQGEHEFPVPVFTLPDPRAPVSLERLMEYESICLFVDRARQVKPDFTLTEENAHVVVEICSRLDGLPLAIELAASRVRMLPPQALLKRLDHALSLLTGGARNLPARQQTLRATIAWSYELLNEEEQALLQVLAVFAGGFTLDAAIAVAGESGIDDLTEQSSMTGLSGDSSYVDPWAQSIDVFNGIDALLSKSLVHQQATLDQTSDDPRFVMLETIREFGLEQLEHKGQRRIAQERHARYYLMLAEMAEAELQGPKQGEFLRRLDEDHRNLRAALRFALSSNDAETGLRLTGTLWPFWEVRGYFTEGRDWAERILELGGPPHLRAKTLTGAGTMAWYQGDYRSATRYHNEALELYQEIGDERGIAFALTNLGVQFALQDDYEQADQLFFDSLERYRVLEDHSGMAEALNNLGILATQRQDYERAYQLLQESLDLAGRNGDENARAFALHNLGDNAFYQCDYEQASRYYQDSLRLHRSLGSPAGVILSLGAIASVAAAQGESERGARLYGAVAAQMDESDISLDQTELDRHGETERILIAALGEPMYRTLWEEGTLFSIDDAVGFTLSPVEPQRSRLGQQE
jgi:predicted ATPase/class 3 adenylate cyclase